MFVYFLYIDAPRLNSRETFLVQCWETLAFAETSYVFSSHCIHAFTRTRCLCDLKWNVFVSTPPTAVALSDNKGPRHTRDRERQVY